MRHYVHKSRLSTRLLHYDESIHAKAAHLVYSFLTKIID